jgi:glucosamine-6-phosphate deaminase
MQLSIAPEVLDTVDDVGRAAALLIAEGIETATAENRRFILGCPTGRSPKSTYQHLAQIVAERDLDLSRVVIALMDEYVVRDGAGFHLVDPELAHSCVGYGRREILSPLNEAATPQKRVPEENLWYPDIHRPSAYDEDLRTAGGIDLFLLASGASDGHIGLNQAGAGVDTVTRIVELGDATRRDNLETWPSLHSIEETPRYGITVGIGTILNLSRAVVMIVTGEHKQETARRLAAADEYEPDWPATAISQCGFPRFLVDRSAAGFLLPAPA